VAFEISGMKASELPGMLGLCRCVRMYLFSSNGEVMKADCWRAEAQKLDAAIEEYRLKQKVIVGQISDKSGTPEGCSPEMLNAFLTLKDK
jgi:hypothetical protein